MAHSFVHRRRDDRGSHVRSLAGEALDGTAIRPVLALVANARAVGRSAAKLLFNTSIKLITFSRGGLTTIMFFGRSACFSLSFEIKTVR
jgi:hypothetical protein